ncbi:hypothetical protein [Pseudokineococcus sp. 1T1Z-3]|uniref:hypothetical protein n=1 Tax=Pseudokineococcus sp. 1T1Z-3 TaxID=3132745 RepID=UPI0030A7A068
MTSTARPDAPSATDDVSAQRPTGAPAPASTEGHGLVAVLSAQERCRLQDAAAASSWAAVDRRRTPARRRR